ncbi:MAG: DUF1259 domain-containing protein [Planctomycetes bacterium]|nr:DUF1259 domain-containing protein [Planctomycetota bacterium]
MNSCFPIYAAVILVCSNLSAADAPFDTAKLEEATGLKGAWNEQEGVFKVMAPRTDIKVNVDRWAMPPFMGLTSWAAFTKGGKVEAMVMGDLVLFQDEVNAVMSAALDNGLSVTALHNHFFYDEPRVFFMHIAGEGEAITLAQGLRKTLDAIKQVRTDHPALAAHFESPALPEKSTVTAATLEAALGGKVMSKDGMAKAVFGRKVRMECGCEAGKEMGVNTWAAFAGSDDDAVVDGDFAVHEDELQPVLKALRKAGVNIVAIHHHMTGETPRTLFLHYWGRGKAEDLAKAVKTALDLLAK